MIGKCRKCDAIFHGWALDDPVNRICEKCGGIVEIMEDTSVPEINRALKFGEGIEKTT